MVTFCCSAERPLEADRSSSREYCSESPVRVVRRRHGTARKALLRWCCTPTPCSTRPHAPAAHLTRPWGRYPSFTKQLVVAHRQPPRPWSTAAFGGPAVGQEYDERSHLISPSSVRCTVAPLAAVLALVASSQNPSTRLLPTAPPIPTRQTNFHLSAVTLVAFCL